MAVTSVAPLSAARHSPLGSSRKLSLYNIHSGEGFEGIYWQNGHYVEKSSSYALPTY